MATWGDSNPANATNSIALNAFRMMGGTSPNMDGMTLDSVSVYFSGSGGTVRVAVYSGGALDNPVGATLLEDLGTLTISGAAGFYTKASATNPSIPKNTPLWIAVKSAGAATVYWSTSSADAGDFQTARGRIDIAGATGGVDQGLAFPSPLNGTAGASSAWYPQYITYSVSGGSPSNTPRSQFYHNMGMR